MLGYSQQAGGTHPTGMHSCYCVVNSEFPLTKRLYWLNETFYLHKIPVNFKCTVKGLGDNYIEMNFFPSEDVTICSIAFIGFRRSLWLLQAVYFGFFPLNSIFIAFEPLKSMNLTTDLMVGMNWGPFKDYSYWIHTAIFSNTNAFWVDCHSIHRRV